MPKPPQFEGGGLAEGEGPGRFKTTGEQQLEDALLDVQEVPIQTIAHVQAMLLPIFTELSLDGRGRIKNIIPTLRPRIETQKNVPAIMREGQKTAPPGTYVLSPEACSVQDTAMAEYEFAKVSSLVVRDKPDLFLKTQVFLDFLYDKYGDTHIIPGSEFLKEVLADRNHLPDGFADEGIYWLPGSLFRDAEGEWRIIGFSLHKDNINPKTIRLVRTHTVCTDRVLQNINTSRSHFLLLKKPKSD